MSFSYTKTERAAIIVAAGSGTRMGSLSKEHGVPKVLFPLGDSTAVAMSVQAFIAAGVGHVVVVVNERHRAVFSEALKDIKEELRIVAGGETRAESVRSGLRALGTLDSAALIAVHDAARCFCTISLIDSCFASAARCGAVTAAVPAVDTVVLSRDNAGLIDPDSREIESLLPRERVWQVQTPQVFRADLLRKAHQRASVDTNKVPTDDASLVREFHPVKLVVGDRNNFKITTPDDYHLARIMAAQNTMLAGNCA